MDALFTEPRDAKITQSFAWFGKVRETFSTPCQGSGGNHAGGIFVAGVISGGGLASRPVLPSQK
jgi:hypothetical protein